MSAAPSHIRSATRGDLPAGRRPAQRLRRGGGRRTRHRRPTTSRATGAWRASTLARDAWVAVGDGGVLVGYAYVGDQFRTGELEADLWVHPEHAGAGTGDAPARPGRAPRPRSGGRARVRGPLLDIFCIGVNRAKRELLLRHGYALSRTVYRMAPTSATSVVALPVPEGIVIRPFRAGRRRARHARHDERGLRGPLPPERRAVRRVEDAAARPRQLRPRPVVPRLGRRRGGRRRDRLRPRRSRLGAGARRAPSVATSAGSAAPC